MTFAMEALFRIETPRVVLTLRVASGREPVALAGDSPPPGLLHVRPLREALALRVLRRVDPGGAVSEDPASREGPRLFEQTEYALYARARGGATVAVEHRDPVLAGRLSREEGGRVVHGAVNFGAQVGRTVFTVRVDGAPEFEFETEVFPTKLDYVRDYEALLAEVQDAAAGLALEHLRGTQRDGRAHASRETTSLEWLTLLRHAADELERALHAVARAPALALAPGTAPARAERVRRVDATVRAHVRRGAGRGALQRLDEGTLVREQLPERRALPALDTPEHRWLAARLAAARARLARLHESESERLPSARRDRTLAELTALEARVARLARLAPLAAATAPPPPGFSSLQLLSAPGYREAHRALGLLASGLSVGDGPVALGLKDLAQLYELWCYLTVLRVLSEATGRPVPAADLVSVREDGLHLALRKGRESAVRFALGRGRHLEVAYNPLFSDGAVLVPQRPDILVALHDGARPPVRVLLDAKYRVDASPAYLARYGAPGPPEDALNDLHRYRDAIVERPRDGQGAGAPVRAVALAAALYPYREPARGAYEGTRLARSLALAGVGAVPLLPGEVHHLRELLRRTLGLAR